MQRGPLRPLMTGCILYLLLLAALFLLSEFFFLQILLISVCLIGTLICAWLADGHRVQMPVLLSSRAFCIGAVIPILLAALGVMMVMHDYRSLQVEQETTIEVCGTVDRVYYVSDSGASFLLDVKQIDGKRSGGNIRVYSTGNDYYANPGEKIACAVTVGNEDLTAEYRENILYAFPDGIYAYARIQDGITLLGKELSFGVVCSTVSAWCRQTLYQYLPNDAAEMCIGVFLGDRTVLSAEIKRDFRRVGASHIMAVSGMHLSVLISGLLFALQKISVSVRLRYTVALGFIVLYMGVTGCSPSVVRAGVMWMLACIARLVHAKTDALTSLFTAAAVLCLCSPQAIFDVGFLLSVSASCGLILLIPPLQTRVHEIPFFRTPFGKPLRILIVTAALTVAASIFTMPITLLVFGELSLIAPISNTLLHIPIALLLYLIPLLLLISLLSFFPPAEWILGILSDILAGNTVLITRLVGWMSQIKHILIGLRYPFVGVLLMVFVVIFFGFYRKKHRILVAYPLYGAWLLALVLSLQIYGIVHRGEVILTYSVNHKNDNICLVTDGRGMLIDASDGSWGNTYTVWEQIAAQNITELDVYALTHYHKRHITTLSRLMQNTVVKSVLLPMAQTEEEAEIQNAIQTIAEDGGITVHVYQRGEDEILFGEASLSFFDRAMIDRSVQPLLGWQVSAHGTDVVYLGAAAMESEEDSNYVRQRDTALRACETLLLGIHGPLYKQDFPALLDILQPDISIVCADDGVRDRLCDTDLAYTSVYSVESDGTVRVVLHG